MSDESKKSLLEIYKLHSQLSDNVSVRRGQANMFYITLLSAILSVLTISTNKESVSTNPYILLSIGILGLLLCIVWYFNIRSYRQLNSGKFKALHELEEKLDYPFFKREWELLEEGKNRKAYFQLTRIEQFTPLVISIPYLGITIYSLFLILN